MWKGRFANAGPFIVCKFSGRKGLSVRARIVVRGGTFFIFFVDRKLVRWDSCFGLFWGDDHGNSCEESKDVRSVFFVNNQF